MSSLTILIIRHGEKPQEKPSDPDFGPGLTALGAQDDHALVVRGWQRAGAWAALFGSALSPADFPRPDIVYAANPKQAAVTGMNTSERPWETIVPLCDRLQITPVTTYGVGDEDALLSEVTKLTGVVLIAWEHKRIAEAILPTLQGNQPLPNIPGKWNRTRFDVVLRFDRVQDGAAWSFRQLFPRLLSGDTDVPLGKPED